MRLRRNPRGMPAYVIALIESISDSETYKQYVGQVEATLAPFGGCFIARKPDPALLEGGAAPSRAVILEFESEAQARAWHASPPYQPVMKLRQSASKGTLLLLPGYDSGKGPAVPVGDVYYVEHVTPDPEGMRDFLAATHGWRFEPVAELGSAFVATLPSGTRCGVRRPMDEMEKPITRTYIRVADVEEAVRRAEREGAEIALPFMDLAPHGRIAIWRGHGIEQGVWQAP